MVMPIVLASCLACKQETVYFSQRPPSKKTRIANLTGMRFHQLKVFHYIRSEKGRRLWCCQCDCGNVRALLTKQLCAQAMQSCGCLIGTHFRTHGMRGSRAYSSWGAMKKRCLNPACDAYVHYGGRGIRIDPAWIHSFEAFYADMGDPPDGMTLERVDNEKGYNKDNCVWATPSQQGNNTRSNHRLTFQGETHTVTEWGRIKGYSITLLPVRLGLGWSTERALTTPVRPRRWRRRPPDA